MKTAATTLLPGVLFPLLLTSCTPDQIATGLTKLPLLQAYAVQVSVTDGTPKKACFAVVLKELGGPDINGPFFVSIGIDRYGLSVPGEPPQHISYSYRIPVPANAVIKLGTPYVTTCYEMPILDPVDNPATIDVLADDTFVIKDVAIASGNLSNRTLRLTWSWLAGPGTFRP